MAWPPTLPCLTLLIPLLLPPWMPTRAETGKVVVLAPTEVHSSLGSTVTLPCHLQPLEPETQQVTQIRWKRLESLGDASIVAEFHWKRGPSIQEPDRVRFVAARLGADLLDASLAISELSPGDEANYTCEIHISMFQMGTVFIWLRVFYAPQVSIALYEDIGQQGCRETSLTCDTRSNPEPKSYDWSTCVLGGDRRFMGRPLLVHRTLPLGPACSQPVCGPSLATAHHSVSHFLCFISCVVELRRIKTQQVTQEEVLGFLSPCHSGLQQRPHSHPPGFPRTTGPLPPSAVIQGSRLLIQPTEESFNMTFICRVFNDLGMGQAATRVQLPGFPREPSPSCTARWIILCVPGIMFVAVLGPLVYFWCRRQSCQNPHSAPDNRAVYHAASASQDSPTEGARELNY